MIGLIETLSNSQSTIAVQDRIEKIIFWIIYGLVTNQLYDTFNSIFLLDVTDHYLIFTFVTIYCPQKRIRVKFRDYSRQNLAKLKIEREHYLNNYVQINQDVSSNTNNFFTHSYL